MPQVSLLRPGIPQTNSYWKRSLSALSSRAKPTCPGVPWRDLQFRVQGKQPVLETRNSIPKLNCHLDRSVADWRDLRLAPSVSTNLPETGRVPHVRPSVRGTKTRGEAPPKLLSKPAADPVGLPQLQPSNSLNQKDRRVPHISLVFREMWDTTAPTL